MAEPQTPFVPLECPPSRVWYLAGRGYHWLPVAKVGAHKDGGVILREVGRALPGVFLASHLDVIDL